LLSVEPLTRAAFAPWGDVIERDGASVRVINGGTTDRFHALTQVDAARQGGQPIVSIFNGRRRPFPLVIETLERHPLGSQCFFPLQPFDWLVVVGDMDASGTPSALRCFRAGGHQGVNYAAGAWHHPLLILQTAQAFLVVDRDGPGANCDEVTFPQAAAVIDLAI
jgi:ureidoglycolate lyase